MQELSHLSNRLDMQEAERNTITDAVTSYTNHFIAGLKHVKGFQQNELNSLAIDNKKKTIEELLSIYQKEVAENGINAASGTHLGYIPGGGVFTGAVADFIAAVTNPFASVYYASPGAAMVENEVVNWLKRVFLFLKVQPDAFRQEVPFLR